LKAEEKARVNAMVGSILSRQKADRELDEEMDARYPELAMPMPRAAANFAHLPTTVGVVDVPITIGRSR
jgi:hypothetical protein